MTNWDVIILLFFILGIVFIGEVFTEENIHIASEIKKRERFSFDNENQGQGEYSSHSSDDTPEGLHTVTIRYKNGRLKEQGGIYRNQDGTNVRHGKWTFWSENGNKVAEKYYKYGDVISEKKY